MAAGPIQIEGSIVDAEGVAVAGARVRLLVQPSSYERGRQILDGQLLPPTVDEAKSDADGRYRLRASTVGVWTVRVDARGAVPMRYQLAPLLRDVLVPELTLTPAAALEIAVEDADGAAVPGAWLLLGSADARWEPDRRETGWGPARRIARSDEAGRAHLARATDEAVRVVSTAPGLLAPEAVESSGEPVTMTLVPAAEREIVVRRADGEPRAGVLVRAGGFAFPQGRTDAEGRLRIQAPAGDELRLRFDLPGGGRLAAILAPPGDGDEAKPATLDLADPVTVTGQVVDAERREPVPSALVWCNQPAEHVLTDAAGRFELAPDGNPTRDELYWVQAAAPAYFSSYVRTRAEDSVTVALQTAAELRGRVVDEAGEPLAGATVEATPNPQMGSLSFRIEKATARSDAAGRFVLAPTHPSAPHVLKASLPGYAPLSERRPGGDSATAEELVLVLRRGAAVTGRVVGRLDGQPVAGARVKLGELPAEPVRSGFSFDSAAEPEPLMSADSDGDGRFRIDDVATGRFQIEASAPGYAPATVPGVEIDDNSGEVDLGVIELPAEAKIEGVVVDVDGQPVEGAEIHASSVEPDPRKLLHAQMRREKARAAAVSGADGRFSVGGLRSGEPTHLVVAASGYGSAARLAVEAPTAEPLRIELVRAASISGRVLDPGGRPITGARISAYIADSVALRRTGLDLPGAQASVESDGDGRFEIEQIDPGSVTVSVQAAGWRESRLHDLEIPPGGEVRGIEIVLQRGASITGRIVGADGRPIIGAHVMVQSGNSYTGGNASDGDGRYRVEGVETGWQTLMVWGTAHPRTSRQVEVAEGENRYDITLEAGFEIAGRVVDKSGGPVAGAEVALSEKTGFDHRNVTSAADGSFRFDDVLPGSYTVHADASGFAPRRLEQTVAVESGPVLGLVIDMARGQTVVGRIFGVEADEAARVRVEGHTDSSHGVGVVSGDGSFRIEGLSTGEVTVVGQVQGGQRAEARAAIVEGPAETVVDLEFGSGLTLDGRVTRSGEPLAGARVFVRSLTENRPGQTMTDHEGHFRVTGLAAGAYAVIVTGGASGGLLYNEELELTTDRTLEITVSAASVAGRVVDAFSSEPISGAQLQLTAAEPDGGNTFSLFRGGGQTDSLGRFRLADLPAGSFRLRAGKSGYSPAELELTIEAGRELEGLELRLEPAEGLVLLVTLESGAPARQINAALLDAAGRVVAGDRLVSENGRVRLTTAPRGRWHLLVTAGERAVAELPVTVPAAEVPVVLRTGAQLEIEVPALVGTGQSAQVSVIGADGNNFARLLWGTNLISVWQLVDGKTRVDGLPAGRWTVRVEAGDGRRWEGNVGVTWGGVHPLVLP